MPIVLIMLQTNLFLVIIFCICISSNNRDPFVPGNNCLVMCDTYDKDDKPHPTNYRYSCNEVIQLVLSTVCVYWSVVREIKEQRTVRII